MGTARKPRVMFLKLSEKVCLLASSPRYGPANTSWEVVALSILARGSRTSHPVEAAVCQPSVAAKVRMGSNHMHRATFLGVKTQGQMVGGLAARLPLQTWL